MKNIELANQMIENLDWFKQQPDWQETMDRFRPIIEEIMEESKCDAMKASIPFLRKYREDGKQYEAALLMAICTEMMLDSVKN